jgi:ethanolamine ammonia-lyase large subunit
MPGAGVAVKGAKKSARQLLGMGAVDRFNNLSLLSYNKKKVKKILADQVNQGNILKKKQIRFYKK